jgi:protein-tyrosine-phosphatase
MADMRWPPLSDTTPSRKFKTLFLSSRNSARSVLAEYFLSRLDPVHFEARSAGAKPTGQVNPLVLEILRDSYHIDASRARSKSGNEFRDVRFDFVITIYDKAGEPCPLWLGQPINARWGSADPDTVGGSEEAKRHSVKKVAVEIYRRIGLFTSLPLVSLDRLCLEASTGNYRNNMDALRRHDGGRHREMNVRKEQLF